MIISMKLYYPVETAEQLLTYYHNPAYSEQDKRDNQRI